MVRKGYPVPDDLFPRNVLSASEKDNLAIFGAASFDAFLRKAATGDIDWKHMETDNQIALYEGRVPFLDKHGLPYLATTTFPGSVDVIAQLHDSTTHAGCLDFIHEYAPDILDMVVLETFPSAAKTLMVKWSAVASPWPVAVSDRDFVYLEVQDRFTLPDGRTGWGYCQVSIELPHVPSLQSSSRKLVRGVLCHTGCLYFESATPDCVDVVYHIASDFGGHIPYWARTHGIKSRVKQLLLLSSKGHEDPAKRARETCGLCEKPASWFFRRLRQCNSCGEVSARAMIVTVFRALDGLCQVP
ncbi:hypothetical protein ACHHYP_11322 [Achlya hypogyna]|uniref:START domain-containing protein n=1 Tax=Achlya hypogyna TaxID=1202772 RepID=A0A1V9YJA4_ACHHY|nr:hypothetical protein ACHHYP_11322 [Achlya hypogyna]